MIKCPECKQTVSYADLRRHEPKCGQNHVLGKWFVCANQRESHIYLNPAQGRVCPICGSEDGEEARQGLSIKCLYVSERGKPCSSPRFTWLVDGPPCYMNHFDVMAVEKSKD